MPEPLKNLYSNQMIAQLSQTIIQQYPAFDQKSFNKTIFDEQWKNKELKQRMRHIAECLHLHLPDNYSESINILKPVSAEFSGFEYMFFQDFVECYGLDDFEISIAALEHFTKYASAEFAVRAFILQDENRMMKQMQAWANSENHHVRRLASEGCRPRLPWAISLPAFKHNPQPVLTILKILMQDESEYVRRSVANNLNDISKDNPELVLDWAQQWLHTDADSNNRPDSNKSDSDKPKNSVFKSGNSKNSKSKNNNPDKKTSILIKHACRSLLKQGDKKALSLFGFTEAKHIKVCQFKIQETVKSGDRLTFSFLLKSHRKKLGKCRIEFAIDFVKANNKRNRKVFKISESDYPENEKQVIKYFSFKKISTRKYYAGEHQLTIIINGAEQSTKSFKLIQE